MRSPIENDLPELLEHEILRILYSKLIDWYGGDKSREDTHIFFLRYQSDDPPAEILNDLSDLWPDLRPKSKAVSIAKNPRLQVESEDGKVGYFLWIDRIEMDINSTIYACAGIYRGPLSARAEAIVFAYGLGTWWVREEEIRWVS